MSDATREHNEELLFRPSKRRKIIRKRQHEDDNDEETALYTTTQSTTTQGNTAATQSLNDDAEVSTDISQLGQRQARLRKPTATKRGGIAFSSSTSAQKPPVDDDDDDEHDNIKPHQHAPVRTASEIASARFMAPTGQVVKSDDKYM